MSRPRKPQKLTHELTPGTKLLRCRDWQALIWRGLTLSLPAEQHADGIYFNLPVPFGYRVKTLHTRADNTCFNGQGAAEIGGEKWQVKRP